MEVILKIICNETYKKGNLGNVISERTCNIISKSIMSSMLLNSRIRHLSDHNCVMEIIVCGKSCKNTKR